MTPSMCEVPRLRCTLRKEPLFSQRAWCLTLGLELGTFTYSQGSREAPNLSTAAEHTQCIGFMTVRIRTFPVSQEVIGNRMSRPICTTSDSMGKRSSWRLIQEVMR